MTKIEKAVQSLILLALSCNAHSACVQNNNKLTGIVGLDGGNGLVYATTTSSSNECSCSNVRFRPENTDTKMALTVLLSAKMADKMVRIDLLDPNDCNSAFRVFVQ